MKYKVGYVWSMMDYVEVEAENEKEAAEKAKEKIEQPDFKLNYCGENYLEDSIEIDEESIF